MKKMDKTKEKEIAKLIHKDIEKETRVEMKPVPPTQLDRMEKCLNHVYRMLNWLVIHKQSEFKDEIMILEQLPDISDIIEGK